MSGQAVLEIQALTVTYGRKEAVAGVSLTVPQGAVYALLGRNGAGKSTLVRALLGFEAPRAGTARLFGLDAWRDRARIMAKVGVVPESPQVPPRMSAAEASRFCGSFCPAWDAEAVLGRLRRFQVDPRQPVGELSRGQQTQVSLALALGGSPELLVLDDPTLGLDPVARRALYREVLEDLGARGTTVFITTHDLAGIEGLADRVGILQQGRLLLDEDLESLKRRFRRIHGEAACPEGALAPLGPLSLQRSAFGLEAVVGAYSPRALAAAGFHETNVEGASLEDIFLATVTEGGVL